MPVELPRAETLRSTGPQPGEITALFRSWGILDLLGLTVAELPPAWLEMLNIARHLHDGHMLPGIDLPDDLMALIAPPKQGFETRTRLERRRRMVFPVADDTCVQPLRNVLDFPNVMMPDLLMRSEARKLFDYLLISGGINGVYPVGAAPAYEEYDELIEEQFPVDAPKRKKRQKVYALLDVSNSMRDANKLIFAKALMLAYLITAGEEKSHIYFRTFGNRVHERTDSLSREAFPELASRILQVTPDGSTDIERALAQAFDDIRTIDNLRTAASLFDAPPTEIMLISDCESYSVPFIPNGVKLHTVHLKSGAMAKSYQAGFERIRAASTTFTEVDTSGFRLPETARERWLLLQDGRSLEPIEAIPGPDGPIDRNLRRQQIAQVYDSLVQPQKGRPKGKPVRAQNSMQLRPHFSLTAILREILLSPVTLAREAAHLLRPRSPGGDRQASIDRALGVTIRPAANPKSKI